MESVDVAGSRRIPASRELAYRVTLPIDLPVLFNRWFGPIPPIREVRDQVGEWSSAGQTRTVLLTGGGSMREELTGVDAPNSFSYRLSGITGVMAPLVDHIDGRWGFEADGDQVTVVTWRWTLHPRHTITRPVVLLIGLAWNGYARRALAELETHILRAVS